MNTYARSSTKLGLLFALTLPLTEVLAQVPNLSIPRPSDFQQEGGEVTRSTVPEIKNGATVPRELAAPASTITFDIKAFDIGYGDESVQAALRKRLTGFTGQQKTLDEASKAAAAVTQYLQAELGLYLAYAYIPEQTIADGVVRIAVLEGVLDEVIVNWSEPINVDKSIVEDHLSGLKPGSVVKVDQIERVLFLLNDLGGLSAKFEVRTGTRPGTAKLVVTPYREPRLTSKLFIDGNGSRFTGTYRAGFSANVESPFGRGDLFSLSYLSSTTGGVTFGSAGYVLPVGSDGLKVGASIAQLDYELPQSSFPLGIRGEAFTSSIFTQYPFVRSRNLNVFGTVSYELKSYEDKVTFASLLNNRDVGVFNVGLSGDLRDSIFGGGLSAYELSVAQGEVKFNSMRPAGLDDATDFVRFNYGLSRLNNLIPNKLLLFTSFKGQRAYQNLDISEQCRIGGADHVRAFSPGEGAGDTCLVASTELRYMVPKHLLGGLVGDMAVTTFYDYGRVTKRVSPSAQPFGFKNNELLSGYGVGLNWEKFGNFQLRLSVAWKDDGVNVVDPKVEKPRVYFSASKSLN